MREREKRSSSLDGGGGKRYIIIPRSVHIAYCLGLFHERPRS